MNLKKIKKVKTQIEELMMAAIIKGKQEGLDTNSDSFKRGQEKVRKQLLTKFDITEKQYNEVDQMIAKEEADVGEVDIGKEIAPMLQTSQNIKKGLFKQKITKNKIDEIEKLLKEGIPWEMIKDRPNMPRAYTTEDEKKINFLINKLGKDTNTKIDMSMQKVWDKIALQEKEISANNERIGNIKVPTSVKELKDIPDQKHNLESHLPSPLMEKVLWVTSETFVGNIQAFINGAIPRIVDIAGITRNDADLRYLQITSAVPLVMPDISGNNGKVLGLSSGKLDWVVAGDNIWQQDSITKVITPIVGGDVDLGVHALILGTEGDIGTIKCPDATTADTDGGELDLNTGTGLGAGTGGNAYFASGDGGDTGRGGDLSFTAGDGGATSGNGGSVQFYSGAGTGGDSDAGNFVMVARGGHGTGADGHFTFYQNKGLYEFAGGQISDKLGILDFSQVANTDKTFTFPNISGQIGIFDGFRRETVSATPPSNPQINDVWTDIS